MFIAERTPPGVRLGQVVCYADHTESYDASGNVIVPEGRTAIVVRVSPLVLRVLSDDEPQQDYNVRSPRWSHRPENGRWWVS